MKSFTGWRQVISVISGIIGILATETLAGESPSEPRKRPLLERILKNLKRPPAVKGPSDGEDDDSRSRVPAPFIRVISPNGGESFGRNERVFVRWQSSVTRHDPYRWKFDLLQGGRVIHTQGGYLFPASRYFEDAEEGEWFIDNFQIPDGAEIDVGESNYRVRVRSFFRNPDPAADRALLVADESDRAFTVTGGLTLNARIPGDATIFMTHDLDLSWRSGGPDPVYLELWKYLPAFDERTSAGPLTDAAQPPNGSYRWRNVLAEPGYYWIEARIPGEDPRWGPRLSDFSEAFNVAPPPVTVTFPGEEAEVEGNRPVEIRWRAPDLYGGVRIELWTRALLGWRRALIVEDEAMNDGRHRETWYPGDGRLRGPESAKIRIVSTRSDLIAGESPVFMLRRPR